MANPSKLAGSQSEAFDERNEDAKGGEGSVVTAEIYASDIARLQQEVSALKETLSTLLAEVRTSATRTLRAAGEVVTHQGSALAATASDRAHGYASELESLARRKPLSTMAGALLAGIIIGLLGRRRRA
jgi:ElaB/YqjD/DUF883 family membrane-anchored ribosome-binding protein